MKALLGELDPKAIGAKPEDFIDKWLVRRNGSERHCKVTAGGEGEHNKGSKLTTKGTKFRKVRKEIILIFVELRITMV